MKKIILLLCLLASWSFYSQVGIGTTSPDPSTMLDVQSTSSGFAMPRMSKDQRTNIPNPIAGLQVYDTDYKIVWFYDGNEWRSMSPIAYGRVDANGHPWRIVGASVQRIEKGHYKINFITPLPTEFAMISLSLRKEDNKERDDITIYWRYLNVNGFEVFIQDNDNGFDDGIPTDNMFMFTVTY